MEDRVVVEDRLVRCGVVVVVDVLDEVDWRVEVCVDDRVPAVPESVLLVVVVERDAADGVVMRRLDSTPLLC